jgi:hypothetical protein
MPSGAALQATGALSLEEAASHEKQPMRLQTEPSKLTAALTGVIKWPSAQLAQSSRPPLPRLWLGIICAAIFLSALGVRLLQWQDKHIEIVSGQNSLSGVFTRYQKEARRIHEEGRILFPLEHPVSGDARLVAHPPGYSILLVAIYRLGVDEYKGLWFVQMVCDAAAALLIFLIGLELLNRWVALIGAMLVALSPHLSYYSLLLSPDSLAVLPILLAVYLLIKAMKRPTVIAMMLTGALIGVSCWLTANAMMLTLFLGVVVLLLSEGNRRWVPAMALVGSTILVVAPLTIRNYVVFQRFIPLSIQAGLSLVEGIGDYDKEDRFGMPDSDREARHKDAEWNNRPDYAVSLWIPDGIERDHTRLARGLAVVRSNPGWFLGVMLQRAGFMLSYNDSSAHVWPYNTASVAPISAEAGYGHALTLNGNAPLLLPEPSPVLMLNGRVIQGMSAVKDGQAASSSPPAELHDNGVVLSPQAKVSLEDDGRLLRVVGDNSEYADQFASAPIAVRKNTDYVLVVPVSLLNGGLALKVTSNERRTALASADLAHATQEAVSGDRTAIVAAGSAPMMALQMPFASGNRTEVRLVLSNNGAGAVPPAALLGAAEVFETGPTPYVWAGYPRTIVRSIQRKFTTGRLLTLIAVGIVLLLLARRGRSLLILLVVPFYYLLLQSPLHTEYRYILAIHYFLFVIAATTIYFAGAAIYQTAWHLYERVRQRAEQPAAKGSQV